MAQSGREAGTVKKYAAILWGWHGREPLAMLSVSSCSITLV
jgi:hypothetical protein